MTFKVRPIWFIKFWCWFSSAFLGNKYGDTTVFLGLAQDRNGQPIHLIFAPADFNKNGIYYWGVYLSIDGARSVATQLQTLIDNHELEKNKLTIN